MYTELFHSTLIVLTLASSFLFSRSPYAGYDIHVSAFLFLVMFVGKRFLPQKDTHKLLESLIFTFIISTIVNTTGGLSSPFFFLIYFLLFSLSLFLEPTISITTTIALIFYFLLSLPSRQSLEELLPVFSLALLTPFAMFLSQEHYREKREREQNRVLQESLESTKKNSFLFLSLVIKNHLGNIISSAENFLGDRELDDIKKNARRAQKLIDDYEKTS
jgi:hypothetical protein